MNIALQLLIPMLTVHITALAGQSSPWADVLYLVKVCSAWSSAFFLATLAALLYSRYISQNFASDSRRGQ